MNDLEHANLGDIFYVEWEVISSTGKPTVLLQRVGLRGLTTNEYTRHSVIPTSPWAQEWTRKAPPPPVDPVLALARKLVAERSHTNSTTEDLLAGRNDDWASVQNAIKAIRAGMALAKES